ncbi:YgjV family protein [Saccharospirillum mangrovi]|uniref:YgjV family protein n=1 Tax=Saccharospirillum mangrovi TaxID=2161747 RepID=UPI000D38801F|nr:YgjV family protein [Saccharospirillum mangrovi]
MQWLEIYGYLGSALIAISLMMGDIRKLRWINLVGASTFSSYGLMIQAWPVALLNGFIVLIDIVHLWQIYRRPAPLSQVDFDGDDAYVRNVLVQSLPQASAVEAGQRIRVSYRGSQPVALELLASETPALRNNESLAA